MRTRVTATNFTKRQCLKCRRTFKSVGNGNRLCDKCNSKNCELPRQSGIAPITEE